MNFEKRGFVREHEIDALIQEHLGTPTPVWKKYMVAVLSGFSVLAVALIFLHGAALGRSVGGVFAVGLVICGIYCYRRYRQKLAVEELAYQLDREKAQRETRLAELERVSRGT